MTHRPAISHHIHSASFSSLSIDLQTYDPAQDSGMSTCKVLRQVASRIQEDFILLPCDFIPPSSLALNVLLNQFRTDSVTDGTVAVSCWLTQPRFEQRATPEAWGQLTSNVHIIWDDKTRTLLQIDTPDDLDRNSVEMELRMGLLAKYVKGDIMRSELIL
jgi:translation initiation factor eIF-2B subunit gamma